MSRDDPGGLSCGALIAIAAVAVVVILGGLAYLSWSSRSTGAECEVDEDCNTRACLRIGYGSAGVCTEVCHADEDCPDGMRCDVASRGRSFTPLGSAERHVCVPTGERLRELLE